MGRNYIGMPPEPEPDDDDVIRFYYDIDDNVMVDAGGFIVWDLFSYIDPSVLYLFKKNKDDLATFAKDGRRIELLYPDPGYYY